MTPLAQRIVKELTLPKAKRTFDDRNGIMHRMDDVHCFEVSDVIELAHELEGKMYSHGTDGALAFLPAPKTWIEFRSTLDGVSWRNGFLVEQSGEHMCITEAGDGVDSTPVMAPLKVELSARDVRGICLRMVDNWTSLPIYGLLAIINSPRIIGRRQHMPHRGLERALLANRKIVGAFPLHAWTEIKLEAFPTPEVVSPDQEYEAHLTGRKCLHFCRAHLRVRLGRLEWVSAHWRGDGALGIKRSRYKLAA